VSAAMPDGLLDGWRARVDGYLAARLASPVGDGSPELLEAMRYAVLGGGKRLRPLFVLAAARAANGDPDAALPFAAAVELVHAYSLVHDDLPAMDDDELRRGRPTVHVVHGEAMAILAGDALQALAFETLAEAPLPPERIVTALRTLGQAAGALGMAGGQALDLLSEGRPPTEELVARIDRLKTGALIAASFRLGAEAAGASAELAARLEAAGRSAGLAFQVQDDILDATASTEVLGKTAGKDAAQEKATWVAAVGLAEARRRAAEAFAETRELLGPLGPPAEPLLRLVARVEARSS